jgi:hypothetical protein
MRRLCVKSGPVPAVEEAVKDFNELASEWGIDSEEQLLSVDVAPYNGTMDTVAPGGGLRGNTVVVTFIYWAKE